VPKGPFDLSKGYIQVPRDVFGNPAFRSSADEFLFIWLVSKSAWKDRTLRVEGRPLALRRGQVAYPLSVLSKELKQAKSTIWDRIKRMENAGLLRTIRRTPWLVLSISNFDLFQGNQKRSRTDARKNTGRQPEQQNQLNKFSKESECSVKSEVQRAEALIGALPIPIQIDLWGRFRKGGTDHLESSAWKLRAYEAWISGQLFEERIADNIVVLASQSKGET
jgi:hypothetical protein